MLQTRIDSIVLGGFSHEETAKKLRALLSSAEVEVFSDFDDTLTLPTSLLFNKSKIASFFGFKLRASEGRISPVWIDWCHTHKVRRICIISRGWHEYLRQFFSENVALFTAEGLEIVGFVGVTQTWRPTVDDKLQLIPTGGQYLCDIFEKKWLKNYPHIHTTVINDGNALKQVRMLVIKFFRLALFLVRVPWYRSSPKE